MLNEHERRQLDAIEQVLASQDPRLANILAGGGTKVRRRVVWLVVAALPTMASTFVDFALGLMVGSATVVVVTMIMLLRA